MQQALTLKGYADNKAAQREYVEERDKAFERLLALVESGEINHYQNQREILSEFGKPILKKRIVEQGEEVERWLYRYQTQAFTSPKVYFIFHKQGKLKEWMLVPALEG